MPRTYCARLVATPETFVERWAALDPGATPFQSAHWLAAWYRHFGTSDDAISPVLVEIEEAVSGTPAMGLPLVLDRRGRQAVIRFADLGVSDYNLPLLGPAAPDTIEDAHAAWTAARNVLPRADLCQFEKMPETLRERRNPLLLALGGHRSHLSGGLVRLSDDYEAWLAALPRHDRKEMGRFWRVFTRGGDAGFIHARDAAEGRAILEWLEASQNARADEMGYEYLLDRPAYRDLYRSLAEGGIERGDVILTALKAGDEFVAALYCIARKPRYTMVRIATAGGEWSNCSPGRLIIERTMAEMHAEGYREIDFGIGEFAYKRRFHPESIPLFDATVATSVFGLPHKAIHEAKAYVKSRPALEQAARRAMAWRRGKAA